MAPPLTIVEYGGNKREWKPAEYEYEPTYSHVVEIAKTGRARCRKCSEFIAKDTVRVGVPIKWRGGEYGWISSWQHPTCLRVPDRTKAELAKEIHGIDDLTREDREATLKELTSKTAVALEEVDPNDLAFSKPEGPVPRLPAPEALTRPLLAFQEEGLGWMVANETGPVQGGILADEMGMGKTIQTISMLLHQKAERVKAAVALAKEGKVLTEAEKRELGHGPTLVVVPTSALVQWEEEIRSCTKEGALKVLVYYAERAALKKDVLEAVDVVLTTYPVVEVEWRKVIDRAKMECEYCGKKLLPRTLVVHQKYFCGPEAVRTAKLAKREKKQDVANEKAMRTLKIKKGKAADVVEAPAAARVKPAALPTPANFYRELMTKAGRPKMSMYDGIIKARANPTGGKDEGEDSDDDDDGGGSESSDVIFVSETPAKEPMRKGVARAATVDADDEMLNIALEVSRLEEFERRQRASGRATRSRGKGDSASTSKSSDVIEVTAFTARRGRSASASSIKNEDQPCGPCVAGGRATSVRGRKTREAASGVGRGKGKSAIKVEVKEEDDGEEELEEDEKVTNDSVTPAQKRRKTTAAREASASTSSKGGARRGKRKSNRDESDDEDWTPGAAEAAQEDQDAQIAMALSLDDVTIKGSPSGSIPDSAALVAEDDVDLSDSLLHAVNWGRIVLDEAHKIKARTTNTAKCIYALQSKYKWCLTGTPLQNRVGELYSLVRFLRMDPHAYYFCKVKGCECKSLCWNFGPAQRACTTCGHPSPRHYSHFNQHVINPINRYGYVGDGRKGFLTLRNDILRPAQLRRTKAERAADVKLPPLDIVVKTTEFDEVERDFYESLYMLTRAKFDGYVKKGSVLHNYAHIFELLSRLRQACDHPYLVVHSRTARGGTEQDKASGKPGSEEGADTKGKSPNVPEVPQVELVAGTEEPKYYCGMCQDEVDIDDAALAGCKHIFHRECIMQYATCAPEKGKKVTCPVCRVPLTIDLQPTDLTGVPKTVANKTLQAKKDELPAKSILSRIDLSQYTSSTKVESLIKGLQEMRAGKDGHLNKAIVFSQYTSMIEIVEWRLKKAQFTIAKLLGSMPVTQRAANLKAFREDPNVSVILMSLKSGGEGLNLQAANYVFVLEPWWNPAVEMQAVMRAHRIGQSRPVTAVRFSTKDSIEERMMQLQDKKRLVFEGCMDGNQDSLAQLTEEDLQFLFKR